MVILTSVGAKSGKVRKNPVMRIVDGTATGVALGGAPENPSWYANLVAHPTVRLQDGATVKDFHAREVSGEEKQRYWAIAEQFWPHFPEYRRLAAGRDIPIMVLEPIAAPNEDLRPIRDLVALPRAHRGCRTTRLRPGLAVRHTARKPDVWMMLALAATRTATIGLGPGVLVPTLRHPMVNASAAAALAALAPGRVAVAFGTGFAGARALGAAPATWSYVRDYVRAFRGLLSGARVSWRGTRMQMMHPDGYAPKRPIDIPILISALGPKGLEVATELADGLFTVNGQTRYAAQFAWAALGVHGTVLADGEPLDSPRVRAAAGPGKRTRLSRRLRIRRRRDLAAGRRCVARHHQRKPIAGPPPRGARPAPHRAQPRRHRRVGGGQLECHSARPP